jgi:hypothetical protein
LFFFSDLKQPEWGLALSELKPFQLRAPLVAALALTPLAVLLGVNLDNRSIKGFSAYSVGWYCISFLCKLIKSKIWTTLGNQKPKSLQTAEHKIWSFVFYWATNEGDVLSAIPRLLHELNEIAVAASPEDLKWFSEGESKRLLIFKKSFYMFLESTAARKAALSKDLPSLSPISPATADGDSDQTVTKGFSYVLNQSSSVDFFSRKTNVECRTACFPKLRFQQR